jgi:hypothetical protein
MCNLSPLILIMNLFFVCHAFAESSRICVFARPNTGSYVLNTLTSLGPLRKNSSFMWGHALVIHIGVDGTLTYLGSPDGIKAKKYAAEDLHYFVKIPTQGKAGVCYDLQAEQEENFQNLMVGSLFDEVQLKIINWGAVTRNCTNFAEEIFEGVTGENLKVRGVQHLGVTSPNILARRILRERHSFQGSSNVLTLEGDSEISNFFINAIKSDPTWSLENKQDYLNRLANYL